MATSSSADAGRLHTLTDEYRQLATRLERGGGDKRIARMHDRGQLSPRERLAELLDPGEPWFEIGLLVAYDRYDGAAPAACIVTVLATVQNEKVSLVAGVTADYTDRVAAGPLVNFVAQQVGGRGGGRPDMAQAGGNEPENVNQAISSVAVTPFKRAAPRPGSEAASMRNACVRA